MTDLICIGCPRGCHLQVDEENDYKVYGNHCAVGEKYGREELTYPTRTLTSTVRLKNSANSRLPVRTDRPIPKGMMREVMKEINKAEAAAPVKCRDIIIENVLNTGANIVASRDAE